MATPLELVRLDANHPGFRDAAYRQRRNAIAQLALDYRDGAVPSVAYTDEEHGVWRHVWSHLDPLHARRACREVREAQALVPLDRQRIPQLAEVNAVLEPLSGIRLWPVAGLVSPRHFMARLGEGAFLATQYMRHHSRPLYTPEPDVIHELVGHAATLGHPRFAALNRRFGALAGRADERQVEGLIRVYWYTLEFGLVREAGELKAYGAGLLSSYGELETFETRAELRPLDLDRVAATPFDPSDYQRWLYVAESFDAMEAALGRWLDEQGSLS
jgi:phenylalanine-4-hydroxylase